MSFNSPAKHERIERHLMRQRGAGARTVSTNFGFAFGSQSEDTSSNATPTREIDEPPAKRRKTGPYTELTACETVTSKPIEALKSNKNAKSRRRLPLEDDDTNLQRSLKDGDDSFVAVFGNKKTSAKSSNTQRKSQAKAEVETPLEGIAKAFSPKAIAANRPRRCAAAKATTKVAEGLVEEATSIDKKRQVPEPKKRAVGPRGKNVAAKPKATQDQVQTDQPDEHCTTTAKPLRKQRAATKKCKAQPDNVVEAQDVDAIDPETDELAANVAVSSNVDAHVTRHDTKSRKSTKRSVPSKPKAAKPQSGKPKRQNGMEAAEATQLCEQSRVEPPPSRFTKASRTKKVDETIEEIQGKRRALAEADINIAMHSPSPMKATQQPSKDPQPLSKTKSRPPTKILEHPPASPAKVVASKKRKLNIKLDTIEHEDQITGTEYPSECVKDSSSLAVHIPGVEDGEQSSLDWAATKTHRSADQQQGTVSDMQRRGNLKVGQTAAKISSTPQGLAVPTLQSKRRPNGKTKASTISCEAGGPSSAPPIGLCTTGSATRTTGETDELKSKETRRKQDDDVDWLFESQPQADVPKRTTAKSKPASVGSTRSKFKMPDMDLDDLLSNIASFAHDKAMPGALDIPLFAGSQQKSKGSSRKKTKP